ncbi:Oidioi.mRNA.OKI2018_I69.PAR.g8599.t1.cds [Oikopleura dioica]|uniref:Oidioi.mRNA.OKI2018_I69.PAR.g8599.t1.cds n=1 Tax=Oikopleura dioica TaxID=34765 RepID=A0ABN7RGP9_OIKDI|nr:Oidioi.mRNA.OKI2018_I69.PAR.g8599.t1.cds [Oikopleura dioica]
MNFEKGSVQLALSHSPDSSVGVLLRGRLSKILGVSEKGRNNAKEAVEKFKSARDDFQAFLKGENATEFNKLELASMLYLLGSTVNDQELFQKSSDLCNEIKERGLSPSSTLLLAQNQLRLGRVQTGKNVLMDLVGHKNNPLSAVAFRFYLEHLIDFVTNQVEEQEDAIPELEELESLLAIVDDSSESINEELRKTVRRNPEGVKKFIQICLINKNFRLLKFLSIML